MTRFPAIPTVDPQLKRLLEALIQEIRRLSRELNEVKRSE